MELYEENVYLKRKRMYLYNLVDWLNENCGFGVCVYEIKEKFGYVLMFDCRGW